MKCFLWDPQRSNIIEEFLCLFACDSLSIIQSFTLSLVMCLSLCLSPSYIHVITIFLILNLKQVLSESHQTILANFHVKQVTQRYLLFISWTPVSGLRLYIWYVYYSNARKRMFRHSVADHNTNEYWTSEGPSSSIPMTVSFRGQHLPKYVSCWFIRNLSLVITLTRTRLT